MVNGHSFSSGLDKKEFCSEFFALKLAASTWWNKIPQPEKQQTDIFMLSYFENDYHFHFIPINLPS
ncbi:MAG: hypothetical protein AAFQ80_24725 [Cyanobacteria bacterium J06621_8]